MIIINKNIQLKNVKEEDESLEGSISQEKVDKLNQSHCSNQSNE